MFILKMEFLCLLGWGDFFENQIPDSISNHWWVVGLPLPSNREIISSILPGEAANYRWQLGTSTNQQVLAENKAIRKGRHW